MGGLLVLFLVGLYLWGAYKVVRRIKPVWGKTLAVVAVVLIPTADAVYGRIKLKQMCEAEGGLKIYRTVEGVEGFYVDRLGPTPEWITKYGYRFVEGESLGGKPMRLSRGQDGKIVEEKDVALQSRYRFTHSGGQFGVSYTYDVLEVMDTTSMELLGQSKDFGYQGGWVERFIAALYAQTGYGGECGFRFAAHDIVKVVTSTLKPVK